MVLLFLLFWFGFFFIVMAKKKSWICHPIVWLVMGWGFCFGLYQFSGINYYHKLSFLGGVYYWAVPTILGIGFWLGRRVKFRVGTSQRVLYVRPEKLSKQSYYLYTISVVSGTALCVFDVLRLNHLSFDLHKSLSISAIGNIGILLSGLGLILWLYELTRAVSNNEKIRLSGFLCAGCYLVPALITSGRQSILILLVATLVAFFFSLSKVKKYDHVAYLIIPFLFAAIVLFVYITLISSSRTEVSNKINLFNYIYRSTISESTVKLLDKLGIFKTFFMETLYYYSHELSMFEILFSSYDGPMFYGLSQLTILGRSISVGDGMTAFDLLWSHLDAMSASAGVYSHVWRSAAGNCIMDFGFAGGLIYALLCGGVIGTFYRRVQKATTVYNFIGLALVCAGMLFAMQFSPICENYWLYPFVWWLILPIVENALKR